MRTWVQTLPPLTMLALYAAYVVRDMRWDRRGRTLFLEENRATTRADWDALPPSRQRSWIQTAKDIELWRRELGRRT